jgi:hypothetical protein
MVVMRQYNYNKRKKQRIAAMREQRRREAEERRKHMSEFSYFDESLK